MGQSEPDNPDHIPGQPGPHMILLRLCFQSILLLFIFILSSCSLHNVDVTGSILIMINQGLICERFNVVLLGQLRAFKYLFLIS